MIQSTEDLVALKPTLKTRRVVTGRDEHGRSVVVSDSVCAVSLAMFHRDFVVNDAWIVDRLPTDNREYADPCSSVELDPPPGGNVFRIVQFPPDSDYVDGLDAYQGFSKLGASGATALANDEMSPHPLMHTTSTLDYIVVIQGEIYAVLEGGETLLRPGDVLIQRGTKHAWSNRSGEPCIIAAVLNAANPID